MKKYQERKETYLMLEKFCESIEKKRDKNNKIFTIDIFKKIKIIDKNNYREYEEKIKNFISKNKEKIVYVKLEELLIYRREKLLEIIRKDLIEKRIDFSDKIILNYLNIAMINDLLIYNKQDKDFLISMIEKIK